MKIEVFACLIHDMDNIFMDGFHLPNDQSEQTLTQGMVVRGSGFATG
jgi:hypothetical protein